jgi:hypothetical protein
MTYHITGLWALDAVKRLQGARENFLVVETVCIPKAWGALMQRYGNTLAAGEATPVPEEEV